MKPLKSYLNEAQRHAAQALSAFDWYQEEAEAARMAGDEETEWLWILRTPEVPADVLLSLYKLHGAQWMRDNAPADWEARRIWGHDWLERDYDELLNAPAYNLNIEVEVEVELESGPEPADVRVKTD
ncbi:MAG: hypothetical protein LBE21_04220 [Pseudomonadales bacterium]|jgi:hypothetical protein|nr:hypothetical protein [Pseudomonadales bacterium]